MAYPTPDNVTDLATWFQYSNTITNDMFGVVISILIFVVFLMVFSKFGGVRAFALSSFVAGISVIMLRAMGIVGDLVVLFGVIFTIAGVIALIFADRD